MKKGANVLDSETISDFLAFLREARERYGISLTDEHLADEETQDILHRLELDDGTPDEDARLVGLLRNVRRRRRVAKDTKEITALISEWAEIEKTAVRSLERLLGNVRKLENRNKERFYANRTTILDEQAKEEMP